MAQLSLTPHDPVEALEFPRGTHVEFDHLVECFSDPARLAGPFLGQTHVAVATLQRDQGGENGARFTVQLGFRLPAPPVVLGGTRARTLSFGRTTRLLPGSRP